MIRMHTNRILVVLLFLSSQLFAQSATQKAWDILNAATSDSSAEKRANSVSVLGLITKDAHAQELAVKALADEKAEVRSAAADALGDMQAKGAIPQLKQALKDKEVSVVMAAAHSLYQMKDPLGYEVYYAVLTGERKSGQGLLADQKKMLGDPKKMAQFGFEQGIGFIPFAGIGLGAVKAVTKDDATPVRAAATKMLATDPDPRSGDALVKATHDEKWLIRAAALDAIAHRGDPNLSPAIEPTLNDDKDVVRYVGAAAILRLNSLPAKKTSAK